MKRNLSSQAIKAMAIGMAITMGSSSMAYADQTNEDLANIPTVLPELLPEDTDEDLAGIPVVLPEGDIADVPTLLPNNDHIYPENSNNDATITYDFEEKTQPAKAPVKSDTIIVTTETNTYTFTVDEPATADDTTADGTVTLTSIDNVNSQQLLKETFTGNIDTETVEGNTVIKVTTNESSAKNYYFKITKIGSEEASSSNSDIDTIQHNGSIGKGKTISATDFMTLFTKDVVELGTNALNGLTINGDVKLSTKTDGVKLGKNAFKNLKVTGNFDLSEAKFLDRTNSSSITDLSDLGLGALDSEIVSNNKEEVHEQGTLRKFANYGIKVTGELKLPKGIIVDNASLKNTEIGKIDLSSYNFKGNSKTTLPEGLFGNSKIDTLILSPETKVINVMTFAGAELTNFDFTNITSVLYGGFMGATINNDLNLSGKSINKLALSDLKDNDKLVILKNKTTNIKGNLNLSNTTLENSDNGIAHNTIIEGDLILDNTNIPVTTDENGAFGGVTIKGGLSLLGVETIPANAFKGATLPKNFHFGDVKTIGANAFANLKNTEEIYITLPNYTTNHKIDNNAFGDNNSTTKAEIAVINFDKTLADKFNKDIVNKKVTMVEHMGNFWHHSDIGSYRFVKGKEPQTVTLVEFTPEVNEIVDGNNVEFKNGVLTFLGVEYNLTTIGDGKNSLTTITNEALFGENARTVNNNHIQYVTTIADNAFKDNKVITMAYFPKVENVGANAFTNTNLISATLGTETDKTINIPSNAFSGVNTLKTVDTNTQSKDSIKNAIQGSNSNDVSLDAGGNSETVNPTPPTNNGGGSTGGSSGGGGANIGTTNTNNSSTENNTNTNTENNNNNNNSTVVEDKTLGLDVISLPSVTGEPKVFVDVANNHWAKSHIDKLSTAGIINGDQNGNFNLNGQTKRADVTIMLVKLLGLTPETNTKFNDVDPNAYYAAYVGAASNYGIVNGSNGNFNPNGIISRQDTMVMIAQILKGLNLNVNTDTSNLTQFSDVSKISPYANESVAILVNSGIITGNNGKLNPTAPVTRAEMATIMSKLYDVLASAK